MFSSVQDFVDRMAMEKALGLASDRYETASEEIWSEILDTRPDLAHAVTLYKVLPDSILVRLAQHQCGRIRLSIAWKRRLPAEALDILASDKDETIRLKVTTHDKTPTETLKRLAADEDADIAERARANLLIRGKDDDDPELRHLAVHGSPEVKRRIARRKGLPTEIYELLATDDDDEVRRVILAKSRLPLTALQKMAEKDGPDSFAAKRFRQIRKRRQGNRGGSAR